MWYCQQIKIYLHTKMTKQEIIYQDKKMMMILRN